MNHAEKKSSKKRMSAISRLFGTALVYAFLAPGGFENCEVTGWEKVAGVRPESIGSKTALFSAVNSNGIVGLCFARCERVNCTAFVVDFGRSVCYSVELDNDELLPEANSTFYHRICVKVPENCIRERLWQVERTSGAVLIDSSAIRLPQTMTRSRCYEKCMEAGKSCRSAQFRTSSPLAVNDTVGKCSLSMLERGTRPQAYRASMYRDEYLQDQCRSTVGRRDYCSYSEFRNVTLPYSDIAIPRLNDEQCEERCDRSADGFVCKSYTIDRSSDEPLCLLHSEDTTSLGVSSLISMANVAHREREACLDLKVRCADSTLTVELKTTEGFFGRMYASGFAETCGVQGIGRNTTVLRLPLPKPETLRTSEPECGLGPAYSIDDQNRTRTLLWATIVVQFNPIIQRLGDQAVRVGCSLDDQGSLPLPRNVSVHSSFSFLDPNAGVPPIASTVVNVSSEVPVVTMRILDEELKDAVVTQLGQKLILRIEIKPADGPYDIAAGHLVASSASGDSSYLLIDEAGCPTDPATFPALSKDPQDDRSLISSFTAFKFPDSQLVRFNVIVRFCFRACAPAVCREGRVSYGRRRRRANDSAVRESSEESRTEQVFAYGTPDELPLQLSIIVQSPPVVSADPLLSRDTTTPDTVLIAGTNSVDGLLCVDASLALGLLIFWLIIQIALIVGCLLAVAQYRRTAIQAEEDRADILARHLYGIHGGNFEIARRVRWADGRDTSSSHD